MKVIFSFVVLFTSLFLVFPGSIKAFNTTINIDPYVQRGYVEPQIWGINYEGFSQMDSLNDFYSYIQEKEKLQSLKIKIIRYPGGCTADFYDFRADLKKYTNRISGTYYEDKFINVREVTQLARDIGAQVMYQVNIYSYLNPTYLWDACNAIPEYPPRNLTESEKITLLLNDITQIATNYPEIKYFELGNEQWFGWAPDIYKNVALQFARRLKSINSSYKIGLVGWLTSDMPSSTNYPVNAGDIAWTNMIISLKNEMCGNVRCFDFVNEHPYSSAGYNSAISASYNFPGQAAWYPLQSYTRLFEQRVREYAPLELSINEWNLICWTDNRRSGALGKVEHGFFIGESLALMAKYGVSSGALHDTSASGSGCGILNKSTIFPGGEAYKLTSFLADSTLVDSSVTTSTKSLPLNSSCTKHLCYQGGVSLPYVSAYVVDYGSAHNYKILIFNRHETEASQTQISGIPVEFNRVSQTQLKANSYTDTSFQSSSTSFSVTQPFNVSLPPLSITAMTLSKVAMGDVDGNGRVNVIDYQILSNTYGKAQGQNGYDERADFIRDGKIDNQDYQVLVDNFQII